jgi:stage III sporulation protein AD
MYLLSIIGFCIVSAVLLTVVRQYKPEYAMLLSVACGVVLLFSVVSEILGIVDTITEITQKAAISSESIAILVKSLGICYIAQLAKDCCADSGETSLANKIDIVARVALAVLSLPLITQILNIITDLLK